MLGGDDAGLAAARMTAPGLVVTDWKDLADPKLNGRLLPLEQDEPSLRLAIAPDRQRFVLGTAWQLRLFDRGGQALWQQSVPSDTFAVNISPDGCFVVAAHSDGTIRWHRFKDGREVLAFFPHADRKRWIAWTPEGFYATSGLDAEDLCFHSSAAPEREDVEGFFVDGGCSPHNNPSLQALMTATMDGYRFKWSASADKLLLVSVGTGKANPAVDTSSKFAGLAAAQGVLALKNLMEDCGDLVETMLQWLSAPTPTSREIDREMGHAGPALDGNALLTYQRYNALFTKKWFKDVLGKDVDAAYLENLQEMDRPENLDALRELGQAVAKQVQPEHLPASFDVGVRMG